MNIMWQVSKKDVVGERALKLGFHWDGSTLSYRQVLEDWCHEQQFREVFMAQIRDAPFTALRWETPALSTASLAQEFECVLLDSPHLDVPENSRDFHDYLLRDTAVVDFPNLGGDAHLVAPCRLDGGANYCHLAAFHRTAPLSQQHALWRAVGECMLGKLSPLPIWLNTAGGGVDWLHVRLDRRPKYYGYAPYREGAS